MKYTQKQNQVLGCCCMETEDKKEGSLGNVVKAGILSQEKQKDVQFSIDRAGRWFSWLAGIILAIIPLIVCGIGCLLYSDEEELLNNYQKFISDFSDSGSFLWLSITVLAMSLLDLLLYGMRETESEISQFWTKMFVVLSIMLVALGICIYICNIQSPINAALMCGLSWTAFAFFCVTSGIIRFKLLKEA